MPIKIMFVCWGNICRSPTAHGILDHLLREKGLTDHVEVASSGTGSWHIGNLPHKGTREAARNHGIDLDYQRAQQISRADLSYYNHIYVLDESVRKSVLEMIGSEGYRDRVEMFSDYDPVSHVREVPDPYFDGRFEEVFQIIERTCIALLGYLIDHYNLPASSS